MDLPEPLDDLTLKGIPKEPLQTFLEHHGFKSLLSKLGGPTSSGSSLASAFSSQGWNAARDVGGISGSQAKRASPSATAEAA